MAGHNQIINSAEKASTVMGKVSLYFPWGEGRLPERPKRMQELVASINIDEHLLL